MAWRRSVTWGVIRRSRTRRRWASPITPSRPARMRSTVAASSTPSAGEGAGAGAVADPPLEHADSSRTGTSRRPRRTTLMLSHVVWLCFDLDDLHLQVAAGRLVFHDVALP